jgi:hypothetical protein
MTEHTTTPSFFPFIWVLKPLPRLALNLDPLDLSLSSSWGYRCEPPDPDTENSLKMYFLAYFVFHWEHYHAWKLFMTSVTILTSVYWNIFCQTPLWGVLLQMCFKQDKVVLACNPSTSEAEAGRFWIFKPNLGYITGPHLKWVSRPLPNLGKSVLSKNCE